MSKSRAPKSTTNDCWVGLVVSIQPTQLGLEPGPGLQGLFYRTPKNKVSWEWLSKTREEMKKLLVDSPRCFKVPRFHRQQAKMRGTRDWEWIAECLSWGLAPESALEATSTWEIKETDPTCPAVPAEPPMVDWALWCRATKKCSRLKARAS